MIMFMVFLVILPLVSAIDWDSSLSVYYDFNSTKDLVVGSYNLSAYQGSGGDFVTGGKIGYCANTTIAI